MSNLTLLRLTIDFVIIVAALLLGGCSVKSSVILPDGARYQVESSDNGLVSFKQGEVEILVDNRDQPGPVSEALGLAALKLAEDN